MAIGRKAQQSRPRIALETSQVVSEGGALRPVLIEVQDGFVLLRLRGQKASYAVPWGAVYHLAVAHEAERELRTRRAQMGF